MQLAEVLHVVPDLIEDFFQFRLNILASVLTNQKVLYFSAFWPEKSRFTALGFYHLLCFLEHLALVLPALPNMELLVVLPGGPRVRLGRVSTEGLLRAEVLVALQASELGLNFLWGLLRGKLLFEQLGPALEGRLSLIHI